VIFLVVVGEVCELKYIYIYIILIKYRRSLDKKLDACVKKWLVKSRCWYSFRYGDLSPCDSPNNFVLLAFLGIYKNDKRLVGGTDYAHSDD
jgi:hypothetical protein